MKCAMQVDDNSTGKKGCANIVELFFNLIRCGMGKCDCLSRVPGDVEWGELFEIAKKQTLVGIAFAGIERLPQEQRPPKDILLQWYKMCMLIKKSNADLNRKCAAVSEKFRSEGFENCILKGQGLAQLYPDPTLRTPGDIDIWLGGGDKKAIGYVRRFFPECKPTYHHVDFPIALDLEIEIHYRPSWAYSPFANKRLQRFFLSVANEQFGNYVNTPEGAFPVPNLAFNRVYVLLHIYRHLFQEGIGLRQMLDYYYVLDKGFAVQESEECEKLLKVLGLKNFATATMYILKEKFGLENENLIVRPDARRGEFLLKEIMIAGNFGNYDSRYKIVSNESEVRHFLNSMKRITRLVAQYPSETLWSPYFKIWHFFWRKRH